MKTSTAIQVVAKPELKDLARRIAEHNGLTVSSWVRRQIVKEARSAGLLPDQGDSGVQRHAAG